MKKTLLLLLALAFCLGASDAPKVTITMIGTNPTFNDDGSLAAAPMQALLSSAIVANGETFAAQSSVSWNGADTEATVNLDGLTLTYAQVTRAAIAIAQQEAAAKAASLEPAP